MGQALENVRRIYLEAIADGNAREAVDKYTGHRLRSTRRVWPTGLKGSWRSSSRSLTAIRNATLRSCASSKTDHGCAYQSLNDGAAQWVTMDMFFTDPQGLILEHWDTIAPYRAETASGEGSVGGTTDIDASVDTEASKTLVREYTKQVLQAGNHDRLDHFVAADLIQHSAGIGAGRAGLAAWLASDHAGDCEMLFKLFGSGDFVVT